MNQHVSRLGGLALVLSLAVGCVVTPVRQRSDVADSLRERTGYDVSATPRVEAEPWPDGVSLDDGLTEDEAVAVALWNNPAFQADLATLGLARAEVLQAGLLRNPVLSLLFPVGPKQFEANIAWSVESLWRRPRRVSMAQLDLEGVAEGLVQHGLDLTMQVKLAYTDLLHAGELSTLAEQRANDLDELDALSRARLAAGEISGLEADADHLAAVEAAIDAQRRSSDVRAATVRLSGLLGLAADLTRAVRPQATLASAIFAAPATLPELSALLERALAARPDLRAAELALEATGEQVGLARSEYMTLSAVLDANGEGTSGFESGPGIALALPLFDRSQGSRTRAAASFERAAHEYAAVRNRIAGELREAYVVLITAQAAHDGRRDRIVRMQQDSLRRVERSYDAGELSYRAVLIARVAHIEARQRQSLVSAELLGAHARLERALGSELDRPLERVARIR